ncbi:xanthine dehydrogenase family protein molybdopterin-binding subunit [Nocardioides massiliensis]|uniref:CO/xanthine dehydrogenase Mo-binding subunit n=1 Tax=Nocardioides massiliensis TaxID=1325935 RepID=A0ABT9NK37_9ACTN|nr:molybdopterin cofactor-binding domain-containing protein [Nocardioides massiliensis]MDP9820779.1 CO/xanthine dehydrogenase Mo-binding subunit [Nocardioides massiliensis]
MRIDTADTVTIFTGKVELGQGILAAIARIAAEELDVRVERVRVEPADTAHSPEEGYTAGSMSVVESGAAVRQAAAEVRGWLLSLASAELGESVEALDVRDGTVVSQLTGATTTYWDLMGGRRLERTADGRLAPKGADVHRIVGRTDAPRADLVGLVTGGTRFVNDLRHVGQVFGRVVRPPSPGARLLECSTETARNLPGILTVVRRGSFLGVVAEQEEQAITGAEALRRSTRWAESETLPADVETKAWLRQQESQAFPVVDGMALDAPVPEEPYEWTHVASYSRPFVMHGSIGPAAAMALWEDEHLVVWSNSQGIFALRTAVAAVLEIPVERVRVRHVVGSGCYGHDGTDDAALDASLLAMAVPGRPVLLQWSRSDEHQWEPYGPPALVELAAVLDESGKIVRWSHHAWGTTHVMRPMVRGGPNLLAGCHLDPPTPLDPPRPFLGAEVGIHRNADPIYRFDEKVIVKHFVPQTPLRTSSMRALGAHANVFAIESFMDELAAGLHVSPIDFRLRHLDDLRARAVLEAAANAAEWDGEPTAEYGVGSGVGLARYKNSSGYAAVVVHLHVDDEAAKPVVDRVVIAADCGEVVDPNGLINQLEGGALQSMSWTMKESVKFDRTRVTSVDWDSYPIVRFTDVPAFTTVLLDHPGKPFLGAGEIVSGPTAAAIANALFDATGFRVRDMPLSADQLRRIAETEDSSWRGARRISDT